MLQSGETSTLLLNKGDILHHTKLVLEVYKLRSRQRLTENVCYLLIYGYLLELHYSPLHHRKDMYLFTKK